MLFLNIGFSLMEFDLVQGGFDNLEQVCHFQNGCHFQHDLSYALYKHMYISVCGENRKGILVNTVHECGLQHFLWHITGSNCIPEAVVASS